MRPILFCLAGIILFLQCSAQTANDPRIVALEADLEKLLADWKAPGFAVAVVSKDKVIYSKGFGYRDLEKKLPVTPQTLFAIGSCTKAFTSALIGTLEKEQKLSIDKPAYTYLPSLGFFRTDMTNAITLRDMMSHRTGLPRHDVSWYLFPASTRDSLLQRIPYMEPTAGVKDKFQYNNFMFLVQGMIAEKATGKTWEQNIKEKFFQPLQMKRSTFSIADMKKDANYASGYGVVKDSIIKKLPYYEINTMGPAGSINSSVDEMSNWVITWINGGKYKQQELLPTNYVKDAMSSQMIISSGFPDKETPDVHFSNYGFGWFLASYRGHYRVDHGGNIDGFSAGTTFFPTDSIGIIVLTNQNGSAIPTLVRNIIADKMLGLEAIDWNGIRLKAVEKSKAAQAGTKATARSNKKLNTRPTHALAEYAGIYSHPGYGSMNVYVKKDSLFVKLANGEMYLRHFHYDIFEPLNVDPVEGVDTTAGVMRFQFHMNTEGNIHSLTVPFEATLKPLEFTRKPKEVPVTASKLKIYEGEYELPGVTAKVYAKGNILYLFVPGQPEYELTPTGEHTFSLKAVSGFSLEFHADEKKQITGVTFIQPNGNFKATRKG